ncbi:MAG: exosortase/archaeosortase family protein, partial [Planctomycetota bacterium]
MQRVLEDSPPVIAPPLLRVMLAGSFVTVIVVLLFWDFFVRQVTWAIREQADWGHTLVIPIMAGYLVYLNRERLLARPFRTTWIGLLPMMLGIGWYMFCAIGPLALRHHNLMGAGIGLTLFGLLLLFFGVRAMTILLFPLLFLVIFGQTISDRFINIVTFRMQDITSWGAEKGMVLMGLDVDRQGNTLTLFHKGRSVPLNVAEACSGMRMLMAFLALGVFMGYTGLRHHWQRIMLVVLAFPTAIFVNVLRVITLALLGLVDS